MIYPVDGVKEAVPVLAEAPVELILGLHFLQAWVFITKITNEVIQRLDVLLTHDASMELGCPVL